MQTRNSRLARALVITAMLALAAGASAAGDSAARLGDSTISMQDVDAKAMSGNMQTYQALYDARRAALDQIIAERLLEAEAAKAEKPVEEYVQEQIEARVTPVTDEAIQAFYQENQARMGGRELDAVREQIRAFLTNQQLQQAQQALYKDLRSRNNVSISLEPPRVEVGVSDHDPAKGPDDAPIEIVMFSEFQCPYCARVEPTIEQVLDTFGDKVRFVFRDFPLPMHQDAQKAAEAGQCAREQGKFWELHDVMFANQRALGVDKLKEYAAGVGLDTEAFATCLDEGRYAQVVRDDEAAGRALGVSGTPAFFINGRFLNGAQPYENFAKVIEEELELKGVATN